MQPIEPNAMPFMLYAAGVIIVFLILMLFVGMHQKVKDLRNQCVELRNEIAANDEAHDEALEGLISQNAQYVKLTDDLLKQKLFYKSMLHLSLQCRHCQPAPAPEMKIPPTPAIVTVSEAMEIVCEALKNDHELYDSWMANIAMSFIDEYHSKSRLKSKFDEEIHKIANNAAQNFIDQLIS